MAATQGHTQSLHTNGLDEAIALPTDFSARIARNTQLLLQQERGPRASSILGGSHYVERLTYELAEKALEHIKEVEEWEAWLRPIDAGIPKMRIEEAAARTQARIDTGKQTITGVNKFKIDGDAKINLLKVDNVAVREAQIAKLKVSAPSAMKRMPGGADRVDRRREGHRQPARPVRQGCAREGHGR